MFSGWVTVFISLSSLSLFFLTILIVLYSYFSKRLLKHPNQIYYMAIITEEISLIFILAQLGFVRENSDITSKNSTKTLFYLNIAQVYAYLAHCHYILFLNLEIMFKVSKTLSPNYKKRVIVYHCITFIACTLVSIILIVQSNYGEKNIYDSVKEVSITNSFVIYYVCCNSAIICCCIGILLAKGLLTKTRDLISLVISSIIIVFITFVVASAEIFDIFGFKNSFEIIIAFSFIITSSGIVEFAIMIRNRKIMKLIVKLFKKNKAKEQMSVFSELSGFNINFVDSRGDYRSNKVGLLSDLFEGLTKIVYFI